MSDSSAPADKPAAETKSPPAAQAKKKPARATASTTAKSAGDHHLGLSVLALVLVLIVAAALAAGGWWLWQQLEQTRQQLASQQSQTTANEQGVQQSLSALNRTVTGIDEDIRSQFEQQKAEVEQSLRQAREEMRNAQQPDWLLAETAYLIRLANHRLQLEHDTATALIALHLADERLRSHDSPAVVEVRRRLADDIARLRALPVVDIEGLALTLASLQRHVEQLPMAAPLTKAVTEKSGDGTAEQPSAWRKFFADLWQTLSSLVTIRKLDENNEAVTAPEQRVFLKQNLALKLEAARYALLRRDNSAYHDNLAVVRDWLRRYFDNEARAVIAMLDSLAELDKVRLDEPLPALTESLAAIKALQQQTAGEAAAATAAEPAGE